MKPTCMSVILKAQTLVLTYIRESGRATVQIRRVYQEKLRMMRMDEINNL